jgi:hypothetical protein
MAFSPKSVKDWYKDLSVEELEKKYFDLQSEYYFETKNSQIKYLIENIMDASHSTNLDSTREGLEELLKEKTGKEYKLKEQFFDISVVDVINYIADNTKLLADRTQLISFFDKIQGVDKKEKTRFLLVLMQDTKNFKKFVKETKKNSDAQSVFDKYSDIVDDFWSKNRKIG